MNISSAISQFNRQADAIRALLEGVTEAQMRWKPDSDTWSLLEVLNHLYDEEQFDFKVCLDYLLHRPGDDWPPVDPKRWLIERKYNERDPQESLEGFLSERRKSIGWLQGLASPDWDMGVDAPWGGKLTAGDMLAAWLAHDLLHIRQINELLYAWTAHSSQPYSPAYAGEW